MPTSPEKVHDLIDQLAGEIPGRLAELQQQVSGMQAVALGAVSPFLPSILPGAIDGARRAVPADPAQLDAILDAAAAYVLTLKTDPPAIGAAADDDQAADVAGCDFCGAPVGGAHAPSCGDARLFRVMVSPRPEPDAKRRIDVMPRLGLDAALSTGRDALDAGAELVELMPEPEPVDSTAAAA